MFNRNTLEGILSSFTKINNRLEAFAAKEEINAEVEAAQARLANERAEIARDNAATARKISGKITSLIS